MGSETLNSYAMEDGDEFTYSGAMPILMDWMVNLKVLF